MGTLLRVPILRKLSPGVQAITKSKRFYTYFVSVDLQKSFLPGKRSVLLNCRGSTLSTLPNRASYVYIYIKIYLYIQG